MKIIDCFMFYNELDLLNYRLNVLDHIVDWFIIVESKHTHTGKEKVCTYELNKNTDSFSKFKNKIIHIIVEDFPFKYPNIDCSKNQQWANENFHRNCIERGINKLDLVADDVITITDLDEIPDPNTLSKVKTGEIIVTVNTLEMDLYYYNLNSKFHDKWHFPKIVSFGIFTQNSLSCQNCRWLVNPPVIKKGGWHLSYFGDKYFIQNKIMNFSHQEFNNSDFTDLTKIELRMNGSNDLFDRNNISITKISAYHNDYLPPDYEGFVKKYILY